MAQARVCDRCNKTITGNNEYYTFDVYKYCMTNSSRAWCSDLKYDLCKECINDFKDFIKK